MVTPMCTACSHMMSLCHRASSLGRITRQDLSDRNVGWQQQGVSPWRNSSWATPSCCWGFLRQLGPPVLGETEMGLMLRSGVWATWLPCGGLFSAEMQRWCWFLMGSSSPGQGPPPPGVPPAAQPLHLHGQPTAPKGLKGSTRFCCLSIVPLGPGFPMVPAGISVSLHG